MSTIDSGLGWSCDSEYYVADTTTVVGWDRLGNNYKKTTAGGAIAGAMRTTAAPEAFAILSTSLNYVALNGEVSTRSVVIDNVLWYMTFPQYGNQGVKASDFPYFTVDTFPDDFYTDSKIEAAVRAMLAGASVAKTSADLATTNYVKTFVEGVEAETATRVNALDTAKQPKTMSAAITVGGVSQTTVESALGAMATKISKIDFDIHRNLGTEITNAQKLAIANGTFEDLPIGAYWTLNNKIYRIVHHDYYFGTGDTECTSHHIVVVPDNAMYSAAMNDTDTTAGGYIGSKMRTENLATALSTFETDFGATHILNHRVIITSAVSNEQASGWAWSNSKVDLMSENMVYGHTAWGQSGFETGIERGQLALFSLYPEFISKQHSWYWLRSVRSELCFCRVGNYGDASYDNASYSGRVRPYACIYFDDVLI